MNDDFLREEIICGYKVSTKMKKIWAVQLDLVLQLKRVCEKYNLRYFMYAGTLIGAVRHQGYIPWDDDFDIIMPRADYDKLKAVAETEFQEPYFFQTNENTPSFFSGNLSRLRNSNTTAVEYWDVERKGNWGIWIDIIALDFLYEDPEKRRKQMEQISYYQRLNLLKTYGTNFWGYHDLTPAQKEVYAEIAEASDREWLLKKFDEACKTCDETEAFYVGSFTRYNNIDYYKCWYKEDFEDSVPMMFEGIELPAPIGYDRFLHMSRGKYLDLPPIEKRVPKHEGIYDPERPYEELQKRLTGTFEDLEGKKLVIFGSGEMFQDYLNRYGEKYPPAFLVDNDKKKWGSYWGKFMVEDPEILKMIPKEQLHLVICNRFYCDIAEQLEEMGIEEYYLYIQKPEWLNAILYPDGQDFGEPVESDGQRLQFRRCAEISPDNGMINCGRPDCMATEFFYKAYPGSYIELLDKRFSFAVATYSKEVNGTYLYTYAYAEEENWSTYNHDLNEYQTGKYKFYDERYFRISIRKTDGAEISQEEAVLGAEQIVRYVPGAFAEEEHKTLFDSKIAETAEKVRAFKNDNTLAFALIADSHYCVNGTWKDTVHNLAGVHDRAGFDGIIHLGDLTDGMVSAEVTRFYVDEMLADMGKLGVPVYVLQGNHDSNYFRGNPEAFTREEQYEIYQRSADGYVVREDHNLWYYADFADRLLRCIFLDSFDHTEKERYGYPDAEVLWLQKILAETPDSYSILVFSHVPPLPEIHVWSDTIRNGDRIVAALENYNKMGRRVLGLIHGHNHADQIYDKYSFPIISIGCNKCEYFLEKKPEGAQTFPRKLNDVSQDLWDVLIVNTETKTLKFVRFGAGEDRTITN